MHATVSFFDQAAEKLREAMSASVSGLDRMRLMQEALALYHRHQDELAADPAGFGHDAPQGV